MTEIVPFDPKRGRQAKYRGQRRRSPWTRADAYGSARGGREWWALMVVLPLAAFAGVVYGPPTFPELGTPETDAADSELSDLSEEEMRRRVWPTTPEEVESAQPHVGRTSVSDTSANARPTVIAGSRTARADTESARFAICGGAARVNCVVDGDTFWYGAQKIRIADINTPEVSQPECAREAALGAAATDRLHTLLNQGTFTLETTGRDRDRYGRLLRVVTRDGESLGGVLVREGLAEEWRGYRGSWC